METVEVAKQDDRRGNPMRQAGRAGVNLRRKVVKKETGLGKPDAREGGKATVTGGDAQKTPSPPLIHFDCPCLPIAQPRQRHRAFVVGCKVISQNYTPAKHPVQGFKALLILAARKAWQKSPLTGPLRVDFTLRFPLPKSAKASVKRQVETGVWLPHTTKPDGDNCFKSASDGLTGILWADDRQIAEGRWRKVYDVTPGVEVMVWEI